MKKRTLHFRINDHDNVPAMVMALLAPVLGTPVTRERVRAMAGKMGYTVDAAARCYRHVVEATDNCPLTDDELAEIIKIYFNKQ